MPITYYKSTTDGSGAGASVRTRWISAYREGANILILSDRGVDENHVAIPSLLAVSAVQQASGQDEEVYGTCPLSWRSGEPREVHHFATLLGYGAVRGQPVSGP